MMFLRSSWPSLCSKISREVMNFFVVQKCAKDAHQPSPNSLPNEIPKIPLHYRVLPAQPCAGGIWLWASLIFRPPQLSPLAQFESDQLLAHFSSSYLHFKPNYSFSKWLAHVISQSRIYARSNIPPFLANLKFLSSMSSNNQQSHSMHHIH